MPNRQELLIEMFVSKITAKLLTPGRPAILKRVLPAYFQGHVKRKKPKALVPSGSLFGSDITVSSTQQLPEQIQQNEPCKQHLYCRTIVKTSYI